MTNPKSNGKICTSLTSTMVPLSLSPSLDIETVIRFREKFQFDVRGGGGVALLLAAEPTREWDREGTEREEGGDGGIIFQGLPSLCRVSHRIEACLCNALGKKVNFVPQSCWVTLWKYYVEILLHQHHRIYFPEQISSQQAGEC